MKSEPLEDLLDRVMASGTWHSVRIFACTDGSYFVSMGRVSGAFQTDQLTDNSLKPSERLRLTLERLDVRPNPVATDNEIDDLLG